MAFFCFRLRLLCRCRIWIVIEHSVQFRVFFFCAFFSFVFFLRWLFSFNVCNSPSGFASFNAFWARTCWWFFGRMVGSSCWWGFCGNSNFLPLLNLFLSHCLNRDFGVVVHNQLFVKFEIPQNQYESFYNFLLYCCKLYQKNWCLKTGWILSTESSSFSLFIVTRSDFLVISRFFLIA